MRTDTLYNGDVVIDFEETAHRYKLHGERSYLISATAVTGMLDKSQALIPWAVNLARDYLLDKVRDGVRIDVGDIDEACKQHTIRKEKAADTGSMVHGWIEDFIRSKLENTPTPGVPTDPQVQNGVNAFLDWYIAHDVQFHASERLVYSREHGYVGLTDFVATVNGVYTVGDWKTSKRVYPEHKLQLSGYWSAIEEEDGKEFEQGIIMHFDKDTGAFGTYPITREEYVQHIKTFLALLEVKKWDKLQK